MFDDYEKKHTVTTKLNSQTFGDVTLLEIQEHHHEFTSQQHYENSDVPHLVNSKHSNFDKKWEVCIATSLFDKKVKEYGANPVWVYSLGSKDLLTPVSEIMYGSYKNGLAHHVGWDDRRHKTPARELLEAGQFQFFVYDETSNNSHLFDVHGEPIMRMYRLDYIRSGARNGDHDLEKLIELLKTDPQVVEVKQIDIPYYNADRGDQGLEIVYNPERQWLLNYWHSEPKYFIVEDKIRYELLEPLYEQCKLAEPKRFHDDDD